MRTISLRLDEHTDAVLTAYCERHGLTQTDALKAAIGHLSEVHRATPAELAAQFGLIGAFRSAETDLGLQHSQRVKDKLRAQVARERAVAVSASSTTASAARAGRRARTSRR